MKKKVIIVLIIFFGILVFTAIVIYFKKDSNFSRMVNSNFSRMVNCELSGGRWINRGTDEECNDLAWEECLNKINCMPGFKDQPLRALPDFECKHLAACKCPNDKEGGYSFFGCK